MDPTEKEWPLLIEDTAAPPVDEAERKPHKRKGRPLSPEHRAALSRAHTGRPLSPEHRAAISRGMKGKITPKHRAAISPPWLVPSR